MKAILICFGVIVSTAVAFACSWAYPIWIPRSKTSDPLYQFFENGKAGYIDASGHVVITPRLGFSISGEFHDGRVQIWDGTMSSISFTDQSGVSIKQPLSFAAADFSEGLAPASRKGESLYGFVDTTGHFVISPRFEVSANSYVSSFSDGLAAIKVNDKYGYIDRTGAFVISLQFLDGASFSEGRTSVVIEGPCMFYPDDPCGLQNPRYLGANRFARLPQCRFAVIDKRGRTVSKARFDKVRQFSEGLAPVQMGDLWGFIDKSGSFVVYPKFRDARPFSGGLSRIRQHDLYGFADSSGTVRIDAVYDQAEDFSDGLAPVAVGKIHPTWWYIDSHGNRAIEESFLAASPFFKGRAHVGLTGADRGKFAYIDQKGHRVFTYWGTSWQKTSADRPLTTSPKK